jgi:hypothetical protein
MKKIMFNDRYGLTQAVLAGRKTMTRRIIKGIYVAAIHLKYEGSFIGKNADGDSVILQPTYKIGEEVAVAQCYKDIDYRGIIAFEDASDIQPGMVRPISARESAGWTNKMFVRADLMEETVRITNIKVERLQDISDEDAMREGIRQSVVEYGDKKIVQWTYFGENITTWFVSPREAFAALIDRISGGGTWQRNPWVFAYEFELLNKEG